MLVDQAMHSSKHRILVMVSSVPQTFTWALQVDQAATPDEATGHEAGATDDAAPTETGHRKRKRKQHRAQASYHRRKQKNQRT